MTKEEETWIIDIDSAHDNQVGNIIQEKGYRSTTKGDIHNLDGQMQSGGIVMGLTAKEFAELSDAERSKRYGELSSREAYLFRTQYDVSIGIVTGRVEFSEEEKKRNEKMVTDYLKRQ